MRTSIIIPFHNRAKFLRESVESVLAEIDPALDEIIAVDDGSIDTSCKMLADLGVKITHLPRSRGPAAARNAGLALARGEFVTFFDSDDRMLPGNLSTRLDYLLSHPNEIAVGGMVEELIDERGVVTDSYNAIHFYDVLRPPYRLDRDLLQRHRSLPMHLWLVLFRKRVFESMAPLDSWLRCGEDLDFFLRLLKEHTIPFIPCTVGQYRIHEDNLSLKKTTVGFESTQTAVASQFLICKKHGLPLKESPLEVESCYDFGALTVKLKHPNDAIGTAIEDEFARWKIDSCETPMASFEIKTGNKPPLPEEGAIRTRFWEEFKSYEYRKGNVRLEYFNHNYYAKKDFEKLRGYVSYRKWEKMAGQLGRSLFKWLVIKGMEKQGYGYIHGSCVTLNNKTVVFNGDPGSGKSSCLTRLVKRGAQIVTDDTVLFKGTTLFPFDQRSSVRGDFLDRFGENEKDGACDNWECSTRQHNVVAVIFPRVCQAEKSRWSELEREEGFSRLLTTYVTETQWNTYPESLKTVRKHLEAFLPRARFFELLASPSEPEVDALLWNHCEPLLRG